MFTTVGVAKYDMCVLGSNLLKVFGKGDEILVMPFNEIGGFENAKGLWFSISPVGGVVIPHEDLDFDL